MMNYPWNTWRKSNKKSPILSAFVVMSLSTAVSALDLGEMEVVSDPGEPLVAVIPIEKEDVFVPVSTLDIDLASEEEFSDAVVALTEDVHALAFVGVEKDDGSTYIRITTKQPVKEEVVHFLVAVEGPNGRIVREYVIIEEEEVYASHAQPTLITAVQAESEVKLPLPVIALGEREEGEEEEREEETPSLIAQENNQIQYQGQYKIKAGDDLWHIAQRIHQNNPSASFYQVLAGLYQANPNAFIDGNINLLRRGATLYIPSAEKLAKVNKQAISQVRAQMGVSSTKPISSAAAQPEVTALSTTPANTKAAELKILTPEMPSGENAPAQNAMTMTDKQISENLALINEELEKVHRNNESVLERIKVLQTQIATLQELLALREGKQVNENVNAASNQQPAAPKESALPENVTPTPEQPVVPSELLPPPEPTTPEVSTPAPAEVIPPPAVSEPTQTPGMQIPSHEGALLEQNVEQKPTGLAWWNYLALALGIIIILLVILTLYRRWHAHKVQTLYAAQVPNAEFVPESEEEIVHEEPSVTTYTETLPQEEHHEPVVKHKTRHHKEHHAQPTHTEEVSSGGDVENQVNSKLELAKAYHDLGDSDGAIALLQEVLWEGDAAQRQAAQEWLDKIDAEKGKE